MNPFLITIGLILLGVGFAKEVIKKVEEKPLTKKAKTGDNKPTAKAVPKVEPVNEVQPDNASSDSPDSGAGADLDSDEIEPKPE